MAASTVLWTDGVDLADLGLRAPVAGDAAVAGPGSVAPWLTQWAQHRPSRTPVPELTQPNPVPAPAVGPGEPIALRSAAPQPSE